MTTHETAFREDCVDADGFRIRYLTAGEGEPLVLLHGAGGLRITRGAALLAQQHRVIAFEMPGFGRSPDNTRTTSVASLAETMAAAVDALGIARCAVLGTSFGARVALWLAVQRPALVSAVVLEAPAAIRPAGRTPPAGTPAETARLVYAHPEQQPPIVVADPAAARQSREFVMRVRGPDRDTALEAQMRRLAVPVLVLFGTLDRMMPPELGRLYKALLPDAHLVFVYDAGHRISTERPEAFAEVTLDFLQRHAAFLINRRQSMLYP